MLKRPFREEKNRIRSPSTKSEQELKKGVDKAKQDSAEFEDADAGNSRHNKMLRDS